MSTPPKDVTSIRSNQSYRPQEGTWATEQLEGLQKINERFSNHMQNYADVGAAMREQNTKRSYDLLAQMEANDPNMVGEKKWISTKCFVASLAVASIAAFGIAWTTVTRNLWY